MEIKEEIIGYLEKLPAYKLSSNKIQNVVRCPFCGDSFDPEHVHFSIKIDLETDEPIVFRCLKCDISGLFTNGVLEELGVSIDAEFYNNFKKYNKGNKKKLIKYNYITKAPHMYIPLYEDNEKNSAKLRYVNERLGTNIDYAEAQKLKIILNLYDFIKLNNIKVISSTHIKVLEMLNRDYVGFLSSNNNCIAFRNTKYNKNKRYIKVLLNDRLLNPNSFYNIPNGFDLLYTHPINIHIAEGQFDIISVYKNVNNDNLENNYYFAASGFGYLAIIKYILFVGLNTHINLHIYADKDKTDYNHIKYLRSIQDAELLWIDNIYIHRNGYTDIETNITEKDYGIPKERIIDTAKRLKI